ncbi:MAG: Crp/Fnr family transcriptional regulator [Clostridiales bacterium]|jgi:CRP-like cAMP-binding protein|nr:Crp/Fnr family transcriptional regulator [Clostridiales bacterium]OPZ69658.1 MAG: Global nitrogen regulator [Firmicutes bacterium ADurb.Bin467]
MRLAETELFRDIAPENIEKLSACLQLRERSFAQQQRISLREGETASIGLVLEGTVVLSRPEYDGRNTILEYLGEGSVFGETLAFGAHANIVACAETAARVLFLDFGHLTKRCPNACRHHSALVENMLRIVAEKANQLGSRVEVLASRSIREKLLRYFHVLAAEAGCCTFELPFSMSSLADYLSTDRSAMTRELGKMKKDGVVKIERRKITLLPEKNDR